MSGHNLDTVDYGILKCIADRDKIWKKRVHELLSERQDELPQQQDVSVQTVGRRINKLQSDDLLESCIVSPKNLNRDLIIGYNLTSEGHTALEQKREDILREKVLRSGKYLLGSDCTDKLPINRDALNHMFCDQFDVAPENRDVVETSSTEELLTVLAVYYFRKHIDSHLCEDNLQQMKDLVNVSPTIEQSFQTRTLTSKLIQRVQAKADVLEHALLQKQKSVQ